MTNPLAPRAMPTPGVYVAPWECRGTAIIIPNRFRRAVLDHLRRYYARADRCQKPARMLAVQGPPGDGKTEMATEVCAAAGCNTFVVPGAALSGKHEGDAQVALKSMLDAAAKAALANGRPTVIVLDDLDRGVMSVDKNTGHTINSELLAGELQALANDAAFATTSSIYRIPFVLTGNNFRCLPPTLMRPGRVRFFDWRPDAEEKSDMLMSLFEPGSEYEARGLRKLIRHYHAKGEPLAFFVDVLNAYRDEEYPLPIECTDILQAAAELDQIARVGGPLDFRRLEDIAARLHHAKARSFVHPGGDTRVVA